MHRDPLFFRLFKELPGCFFELVGRPNDAGRYRLEAIEYKSTSVRLDGVFQPIESDAGPAYIWETQFYPSEKFYANLLTKIGRFLEHGNPRQDWVAVVIYPSRAIEQKNIHPYRCLLESIQLVRIYLDELPPAPADRFELRILEMIAGKPEAALEKAREMLPKVRQAKQSREAREQLLQLIETVIVHQFPNWSREETQKMIQVWDITQTRVFKEAFEEGRQEGRQEGQQEGEAAGRQKATELMARQLLKRGDCVAEVARVTGLTPAQVRKLSKNGRK